MVKYFKNEVIKSPKISICQPQLVIRNLNFIAYKINNILIEDAIIMSTLCVRLPYKFAQEKLFYKLKSMIREHFIILCTVKKKSVVECYINLNPRLNPKKMCDKMNKSGQHGVFAFVPDILPNYVKRMLMHKSTPKVVSKPNTMGIHLSKDQMLLCALDEIVKELLFKYTGLLKLSRGINHMLMDTLCMKIVDRLKQVVETSNALKDPFQLTSAYRKAHPHFTDFQFILSNLHMLEHSSGLARSQLSEKDLSTLSVQPYVIGDIPCELARSACKMYSERIIQKVKEHINNLKTEVTEAKSEEDKARIKVRQELKNLSPYMDTIVNEVVSKHFKPKLRDLYTVRVYGEPFLPTQLVLSPVFRDIKPVSQKRSKKMFNLLTFKARLEDLNKAMSLDGTVVENNCKLIVRPGNVPLYKMRDEIKEYLLYRKETKKEPEEKENPDNINIEPDENWEEW
ncbi:uncharacterized protein LOC126976174 [Leptidea sinapis]|uniref:uncharacterized protein LOC126976174 n=1 Tax=Leptidea sinapis TaxID=189913 RepID=UPI00212BD58D|nr:uncharacterized protein LOC126976174 [Leptidea sinapis]